MRTKNVSHVDIFLFSFFIGGWLKIAGFNVKHPNPIKPQPILPFLTDQVSELSLLKSSQPVALKSSAVKRLAESVKARQLRFSCTGSRTVDFATSMNEKGAKAFNYFIDAEELTRPLACGSFNRMPNDNSNIATKCDRWRDARWSRSGSQSLEYNIYYYNAYVPHKNHMIGNQLCDDNFGQIVFDVPKEWAYYIR